MPDTTRPGPSSPDDAPTSGEHRPHESAPQPLEPPARSDDSADDFLDRIRLAAKQMGRDREEEITEVAALDIDALSLSAAIESKPATGGGDDFTQAFVSKLAEVEQDIEIRLSSKADEPVDVMDLSTEAPSPVESFEQETPAEPAPEPVSPVELVDEESSDEAEEGQSSGRRRRRRRGRGRKGDLPEASAPDTGDEDEGPAPTEDASAGQLSEGYHKGTLGAPRSKKRPPFVEYDKPLTMPQPDEALLARLREDLATIDTAAVVRYGVMRDIGLFSYDLDTPPTPGRQVVVRTERGVELGKVLTRLMPSEPAAATEPPALGETPEAPTDPAWAEDVADAFESALDSPACAEESGPAEDTCTPHGGCCSSSGGGCGSGCGDKSSYGKLDREQLALFLATNGEKYSFRRGGKLLRIANTQDLADARSLEEHRGEQLSFCREQIRALSLNMRLVTAEMLLGGERMVFYFTAEDRVDFRDLVKELTTRFRTRVELRQVGARDEARLVADYERCGRRCCCQAFVKDLLPVSMRMAKLQKATLDPSKISGRCSRLMCCLRYEDESYRELKKSLPNKGIWLRTASMIGKVLDSQVLCQLIKIRLPDGSIETIGVEEIIERNVPEPELPAPRELRAGYSRPAGQRRPLRDEALTVAPAETPAEGGQDEARQDEEGQAGRGKKRRPRRRRRKKNTDSGGSPASAPSE